MEDPRPLIHTLLAQLTSSTCWILTWAWGIFDVTFDKQSLWCGPGTMGAMLFSNNIDPVPMLKVNELEPIVLPGFLEHLGPVRVQAFFGKLAGHHFHRGPISTERKSC